MSRKHNVKKNRRVSNYPNRLKRRGVSTKAVRMPFIGSDGRHYSSPEMAHRH